MSARKRNDPAESPADDARRRFAAMDTMELVHEWELPMPDETRAVLLEAIEERRYRTKSLPTPPPYDGPEPVARTPEQRAEEKRHDTMGSSATWLFVIGTLHLLGTAVGLWRAFSSDVFAGTGGTEVGLSDEEAWGLRAVLVGLALVPAAIGAVFLVLSRAARKRPYPALVIGFGLFLAIVGLELVIGLAFREPTHAVARLPLRLVALVFLGIGARASLRWRNEQRAAAPDPMEA